MKALKMFLGAAIALLAGCEADTPTLPTRSLTAAQTVAVGKNPQGLAVAGGYVYCANHDDGTISVIDTETDAVVKTLPVENGAPGYVRAFPDGKQVLVADTKNGRVLVFDPVQDHKLLQSVEVGAGPDRIVTDNNDNRTAYVGLTGEPKLVRLTFDPVDRAKPPASKSYQVGNVAGAGQTARPIAYESGVVLVPNSLDNNVTLVNVDTGMVAALQDGVQPGPVAIGMSMGIPKAAVVGNVASNTITVFDLVTGGKYPLTGVGLSPADAVADTEQGLAFVSMAGSNEVAVIDYVRPHLAMRLPVGDRPVRLYIAPDLPPAGYRVAHFGVGSHELWVGNDGGDSVTVIDGATLRPRATVAVGKGHHVMAFFGDKAYVANAADGTVSVVDRRKVSS